MGVERAVTRWYARRQIIHNDLVPLQKRLQALLPEDAKGDERVEIERQLAAVQLRLCELGPCPRSMMG